MKIRMKSRNGVAVARADTPDNPGAGGAAVVVTDAAGDISMPPPPNSRRDAAAADHANGPAPGTPPPDPAPSHANSLAPTPDTAPAGAAGTSGAAGATTGSAAADAADRTTDPDTGATTATVSTIVTGSTIATGSTGATVTDEPARGASGIAIGIGIGTATGAEYLPPRAGASNAGADSASWAEPLPRADTLRPSPPDTVAARRGALTDPASPGAETPEPADDPPRGVRGADRVVDPVSVDDPAGSADADDPSDPSVSAAASGATPAIAAPIPNAIAKAPTRPTYGLLILDNRMWLTRNNGRVRFG